MCAPGKKRLPLSSSVVYLVGGLGELMRKPKTPLEKIKKLLEKLEALHEKENEIVERINEIADEDDE